MENIAYHESPSYSPLQLAELLGLAVNKARTRELLPEIVGDRKALERLLAESCRERRVPDRDLLSTVSAKNISLAELERIKELAKSFRQHAPSADHRAAATLLYHAAIAAAANHHGVNISAISLSARAMLYDDLAYALAGDPLGKMFEGVVERFISADDTEKSE